MKKFFLKIALILLLVLAGYVLNNIRNTYKEFILYKELGNAHENLYMHVLIKNCINNFQNNTHMKIKSVADFYKCIESDNIVHKWFLKYNPSIEINDDYINLFIKTPTTSMFNNILYKKIKFDDMQKNGDYYLLASFSNDFIFKDTLILNNSNLSTSNQIDSLKSTIEHIRDTFNKSFSKKHLDYYFSNTSFLSSSSKEEDKKQLCLEYDPLSLTYRNNIINSIDYVGEEYLLSLKIRLDSLLKANEIILMRYTLSLPYYSPVPPPQCK